MKGKGYFQATKPIFHQSPLYYIMARKKKGTLVLSTADKSVKYFARFHYHIINYQDNYFASNSATIDTDFDAFCTAFGLKKPEISHSFNSLYYTITTNISDLYYILHLREAAILFSIPLREYEVNSHMEIYRVD